MITVPFSRLRCRTVPVILLLLWGVTFLQGQQQISMQALNGGPFAVGDTAEIGVCLDAGPRQVVGFEFYLDINADIFRPVIDNISAAGNYINPVKAIIGTPFDQVKNNTHGDSLHLDPALNNIDGWQLDFAMTTGVGCPRVWSEISGASPVASFKVEVIGIPYDPAEATIRFVSSDYDTRETGYHYMISNVPGNCITSPRQEITRIDYMVDITSIEINPLLPVDTLITPGTGLSFQLSDDHFQSNVPGVDSTNVTWFVTENAKPAGAGWNLTNSFGINAQLDVTSTGATHGILELLVRVEGTVGPDTFFDQQLWKVWIDYPPVFDQPLLASYVFDEDATYQVGANTNGGGVFFTDQDDTGSNITAWLEPDTLVHVLYDNLNNDLIFSADTNRFTTPDLQARLFIQDNLGISADTLLTFMVNSVNDTPVVNFDSVSALGDTLIIYRATPDTLDLDLYVTDVDDASLIWSYTDPYPDTLAVALIAGHLLRLEANSTSPFIDIPLILTATDDSSASASDTLVVSIRSWPPDIIIVEDIRINSQGSPYHLNLADWVDDPDTQPANMTWSFRALDAVTGAVDSRVAFSPGNPLTGDTVNIGVTQVYSAIDLLEMTVTDDSPDSYTDTDTARLFIFDDDGPMIFPLPALKVYRDSTHAGILDLDDYVADILDEPTDINWSYTGGDSLESFSINSLSREVTITTNSTFIGNLIISLVATNSRGLKDSSDLAILVSRLVDGPPIWYAVPDEVEVVFDWTTDLFNYSQVCFDETPTDQIIFTPICNTDSLTVTIVSPDSVKIETPISDKKYTTNLYFSAKDEIDSVSYSGIITVNVKDSFSPVWLRIPTITLNIGETSPGLFLWDYVSDRDTDDNLLTIKVDDNDNPYLEVSYDPVTSELTVQAGTQTSDSWLSIKATDDKGNTATTLVHVVVFTVADYTPPAGGLTYFFNPVADRWIHYVVTADSSTDINRFIWHYAYGSPPRDWSDHLSFVMKDTLPGTVTWIASYHFQNEGSYALTVEIIDAANNMLEISPVSLSVGFSKAIGGVLTSPDRQLTVSYPPAPIPNGNLLIIAEDSLPVSTGLSIAKTLSARGNEENGSQVPAMVYSLDTNLPEPILVTLTYHQKRDTDPYYSFYELDGDQLVKIETYTSADGHFEAAAKLDRDIVFAPSDAPARDAPLPGAELFCYPNPFNATIQVRFLLRWQDQGRIVIYDLLGREVYASPRQPLETGMHAFSWHSIDKRGLPVPSGTYFIRLETDGSKVHTRKVTLLK